VLKENGEHINASAGECYANSPLKKDSFTLVADIGLDGKFVNIVVRPEHAVARCYAAKIGQIRTKASRPVGFGDRSFPVVFNVHYTK
jgi:hypothetical protein